MMRRPIPESYWVAPRFLAGEYPGARDPDLAARKVRRLLDAGLTCFIDLTEADELRPYWAYVTAQVEPTTTVVQYRHPIPDMGVPSHVHMRQTLDRIDAKLAEGHGVYLHCWGGIGRTGTVVGCYLVRHGSTGEQALATIARLRTSTPDGQRPAPETDAQRQFVCAWHEP